MKKFASFLLAATVLGGTIALAQSDLSTSSAEILKMPRGMYFSEVAGVATNSKGDIFVFERAGRPMASLGGSRVFVSGGSDLVQFDKTGKYIRSVGDDVYGFLSAASVRVDKQDNVWVADRYSGMVLKYSPDLSRLIMTLGRKPESINIVAAPGGAAAAGGGGGRGAAAAAPADPEAAGGRGPGVTPAAAAAAGGRGAPAAGGRGGRGGPPGAGAQEDLFNGATDVAFDAQGNIFVADGHGANNRVAKFTPDGVFIKSFGQTGSDNNGLNQPSSLAVDAAGNVYVADPGNKRVQVLSNDLTYKSSITGVGSNPAAVCVSGGAHPYLFVSNSNAVNDIDSGGEIYRLELSGTPAGKFGRAGKASGEFGSVSQMDCRGANTVFTAEVGNYRVQKVTLK